MINKQSVYHHYASFIGLSVLWMHHFIFSMLLYSTRPDLAMWFLASLCVFAPVVSYLVPVIYEDESRIRYHQALSVLCISIVGSLIPNVIKNETLLYALVFSSHGIIGVMVFTLMCHLAARKEEKKLSFSLGIESMLIIGLGAQVSSIVLKVANSNFTSFLSLLVSNLVTFFLIMATGFAGKRLVDKMHLHYENELKKDPLTGLTNRRGLFSSYDEFRKNHPKDSVFLMIAADIDYFKNFNDKYGHAMGDECLSHVSESLQKIADDLGLSNVSRYGGEEFVCMGVIEDTSALDSLAQQWKDLHWSELPYEESPFKKVTLSAGCSTFKVNELREQNFKKLFEQVDELLYEAKRTRNELVYRDRVVEKVFESS